MAVRADQNAPIRFKFTNISTVEGASMASMAEVTSPGSSPPDQTTSSRTDSTSMVVKWKSDLEKRKSKVVGSPRQPGTLSLYQKASFFGQRVAPQTRMPPRIKRPKGLPVKVAPVLTGTKPYVKVRPSEQCYQPILPKSSGTVNPLRTTPTVVAQQSRMPSPFTILTPIVSPAPMPKLATMVTQPQPIIIRQIPVEQTKGDTTGTIGNRGLICPVNPIVPTTSGFKYIKGVDVNSRLGVPGYFVPVCRGPSGTGYIQSMASSNVTTKTSSIISSTQHQIQSILNEYTTTLGSESKAKYQHKQKTQTTTTLIPTSTAVTVTFSAAEAPPRHSSTTSSTTSGKEVCQTVFHSKKIISGNCHPW